MYNFFLRLTLLGNVLLQSMLYFESLCGNYSYYLSEHGDKTLIFKKKIFNHYFKNNFIVQKILILSIKINKNISITKIHCFFHIRNFKYFKEVSIARNS